MYLGIFHLPSRLTPCKGSHPADPSRAAASSFFTAMGDATWTSCPLAENALTRLETLGVPPPLMGTSFSKMVTRIRTLEPQALTSGPGQAGPLPADVPVSDSRLR